MQLKGKAAIANARLAYQAYEQVIASQRWQQLRVLDELATVGADFDAVTGQLEHEGLAKFEKSWNDLSHTIAAELDRNHPARQS
jgi:transaldolase